MLELWIADLYIDETKFKVPTQFGTWVFERRQNYTKLISEMEPGQCANTFYAYNEFITPSSSTSELSCSTDDLICICLLLSYLTSKCVTPTQATPQSDILYLGLGDKFIRSRAINYPTKIKLSCDLNTLFSSGSANIFSSFNERRMMLFLINWISGMTCFSLEDLFLNIGVQMDIVKQCEIEDLGSKLTYFEGMKKASNRYGISQLNSDYKNMRNDIVHEGKISGTNFSNKTKEECSEVVANTLNWIDEYISKVCKIDAHIIGFDRWAARDLYQGLPSISLYL